MIFSLYFAISYNTKTNKYHQQKNKTLFIFLFFSMFSVSS
ncbi:hypothetical protein ECDEC8E_0765 [Escherichia coli DEC8E]|nr:hypothetical protein ECDEC8E_0765 [Escherichia coli DEC8E]